MYRKKKKKMWRYLLVAVLILDLLSGIYHIRAAKTPSEMTEGVDKSATVTETNEEKISNSSDSNYVNLVTSSSALTSKTSANVKTSTNATETTSQEDSEHLEKYQDVDEYLLAQAIHCEAGGTGDMEEMAYCGQVMLNRVQSDIYDFKDVNDLESVLAQPNQYPETLEKIKSGIVPCEDAKKVAHMLLSGETIFYSDGNTIKVFTDDILWQTVFEPSWNVEVVFETEYHYYSKLSDTAYDVG
jgi:hypothetical protein